MFPSKRLQKSGLHFETPIVQPQLDHVGRVYGNQHRVSSGRQQILLRLMPAGGDLLPDHIVRVCNLNDR